jgi:hydrophobe/amphiphile efflux-1 (HAE1) family protein
MWITKVSINNPVFATMMMAALLVLGVVSYNRLHVEAMPDVNPPFLYISVAYPGASPEAVENDITKPIEYAANTVNGIKRILSTSVEGQARVFIEFQLSTDMTRATQEVRDKIAQIRPGFPRDAKDPLVVRTGNDDNDQPVIALGILSKTRSLREISTLADQVVVRELEKTAGVGKVAVSGSAVRQVSIELKSRQLAAYGLGVDQVLDAIRTANQDVAAGRVTKGSADTIVRVEGRMKTPEAFARIIVGRRAGAPIYLSQVAEVRDGVQEETSIARIDGEPAVGIQVFKVQEANIVDVGNGVRKAVADLEQRLPPDVQIKVVFSSADWIKRSVDGVKETIVQGALLTVLIVFLFLHSWRSTVITGLTLPIAVIATFIAVYAFGFTLNFLTLMALSLCIGLLIDDAIVVRENIVRHLAMGKGHYQAAKDGTNEIGLAVMATTFAIVAVFVPIAFMSGIVGRFFFQFGITVAVAVLVSLFVSFTLDPMLSSVWHDPADGRFRRAAWLGRLMARIERGVDWLHDIYGRLLAWSLAQRGKVLLIAVASFVGSFFIVPLVGTEFIPEVDRSWTSLRLNTPIGSSLEYTDGKVRQVEEILRGLPEVELMQTEVGTDDGRNYARVNLKLRDRSTRRRSQKDVEQDIRARLAKVPGIELALGWDRPIYVAVLGPDTDKLNALTGGLMEKIRAIKGITDLETSMKPGTPAISIRINNELASDLGISMAQVANALRPLVAGENVTSWLAPDGHNYDVVVQLPRTERQATADLGELYLTSTRMQADGTPVLVPLRQIAQFVPSENPQAVKRQDLQRRVAIYANVEGRPSGDVGKEVQKLVAETKLPPGYRFDVGGQTKDMEESFNAMIAALGLAVIFIYLILASQFASFLQPLAIMASLPLSLIGVFLALLVTGTTLNIFSMIGFIMLMGLVTKNAILLVDFANHGRREGLSQREAILAAGQVRLRPIMMTTAAMVFGMLPLALGLGDGSEQQAPMGRAIIGGVITSTFLTLIVVPVIYTFLDNLAGRVRQRRRHAGAAAPEAAATGDD